MKIDKADIVVFSETEKVELLKHLEKKGHTIPSNWRMIHSELCHADEADFNIREFLPKRSGHKFAVGIVSNPDLTSFLDKGLIKVRYRYVLGIAHSGEREIQGNTREFCETIIRADKLYRREDINIMSFKGANPLAKQNYSIFRLQGHWNCRHAWQREIYFVEDSSKKVEDSELIEKKIAMSKKEITGVEGFKAFWKSLSTKFSKEEIVKVNEIMLDEMKFKDVKDSEGKTLRVDGDDIAVGASVKWIDDEGVESDVADGDIIIAEENKTITVKDGEISEVKDTEEAKPGDEPGEQDVEARLSKLENDLPGLIGESVKTALKEMKFSTADDTAKMIDETITAKFSSVTDELKKLPAFKSKGTKQNFSSHKEGDKKKSIGELLNGDYNKVEKKD